MDKIIIEVTQQELQVIGAALAEMPYKIASPVLESLQKQVDVMNQKPEFEEMPEGAQVN